MMILIVLVNLVALIFDDQRRTRNFYSAPSPFLSLSFSLASRMELVGLETKIGDTAVVLTSKLQATHNQGSWSLH
jgi:hypothetical protein